LRDATRDFQRCLQKGWLARMPAAVFLVGKELEVANQDLAEAERGLAQGSFKWSTIQSYYAMFHAARALLYTRGYREKSHHCLAVAMRALFVQSGQLDESLVVDLEDARVMREDADYRRDFSEQGAQHNHDAAVRFLARAAAILEEWENEQGDSEVGENFGDEE